MATPNPCMPGRMLIVGASGGLGAPLAAHYASRVAELLTVSRRPAAHGRWIGRDMADPGQIAGLAAEIGDAPLDALIYAGGTWEDGAFTDTYTFERSDPTETARVLAVNLAAPIHLAQALLPALERSANPRVLAIGALSGRDNAATKEVANTASKFGLRGAFQAMRLALAPRRIGFTLLNPGNVATEEVEDDIASGRFDAQTPIPLADLIAVVDCALTLSPASTVVEIDLAQRDPGPAG